jgi:Ribonuclease G/E
MPVARLLRELSIGETRWVALDADGAPIALYLERESDAARRAVIGESFLARVRKKDAALGGAFVELGPKGEAFLRLGPKDTVTEGAELAIGIAAEARRGKQARAVKADGAGKPAGAARWRELLAGGVSAPVEDRPAGDAEVGAAFADALAPRVTLPGGGALHLSRTEALIAADIDTAGRVAKGGRTQLALDVNLAAARTLAREIHLRGLGGLMVLDCVAPLDAASGAKVRDAFLGEVRAISGRTVKALAPSAFGLMEISADWQTTPLEERMSERTETAALEGLRQLEAAARQKRMGRLQLALPPDAFAWLAASGLNAEARLAATYGARLTIVAGEGDDPEVTETP